MTDTIVSVPAYSTTITDLNTDTTVISEPTVSTVVSTAAQPGLTGPAGPPGSGGGTGGAVSSVNGQTGDVVLTAASVGAATTASVTAAIATAEAASDSAGTAAADVATLAATLAPVATSGDYNDLTDLPPLGSAATHDAADFVAIADAAPIDTTAADIQPTTTGSASAGSTAKAADAGHVHKIGAHASTHAPTGSDDLTTALSATSPPVALADVATVGAGTGFARQGHVHPNTGLVKSTDSRLTDSRTPTAHASTHAPGGSDDLTTALSATSVPVALGTAATGTGTGFSRQGHVHPTTGLILTGDSRLTDARTPTAHASSHASAGSDPITPASIGGTPSSRQVANGYGVSGGGDLTADRTLAVSLSALSGSLGSDVAVSASTLTTAVTTSTLAVGTWLLTSNLTFLEGASAAPIEGKLVVASGSAVLTGQIGAAQRPSTVSSQTPQMSVTAVVVVSTAATVALQVQSTTAFTVKATTVVNSFAGASGWTALRVA